MGFYEKTKATPNQPFHKSHGKFAGSFRITQSQCKWSTQIRDLLKQKREITHSLRIISCLKISMQYKEDNYGQLNCKFYKEWIGQLVLYLKDNWLVSSKTFYKTFSLLENDSQTRVLIHRPVFKCQWLDVPWCNIASMELSFGTKNDFQQRFDITWRLCVQWLQLKQNHFRYFSHDPGNFKFEIVT